MKVFGPEKHPNNSTFLYFYWQFLSFHGQFGFLIGFQKLTCNGVAGYDGIFVENFEFGVETHIEVHENCITGFGRGIKGSLWLEACDEALFMHLKQ